MIRIVPDDTVHVTHISSVWRTGWLNLVYWNISLKKHPFHLFLFFIILYFTLQVHPRRRSTEEPCPYPTPEVNGCNSGFQTGVYISWIHIFDTFGSRMAVYSTDDSTAHYLGGFK